MKSLITLLTLLFLLHADMGNCLTCHPKLLSNIQADERHRPMKTCIKCHTPSESDVLECGEKCFSCHTQKDLQIDEIKEHLVFEECRKCHVDAINELFDTTNTFDQSHQESLKDFLIN